MYFNALAKPLYYLLFLSVLFTSCNGQENTTALTEKVNEPISLKTGDPKIIKNKATSEHQSVYCSLQDKAGNIWFGTSGDGVYCFDGTLFTHYTVKDGLSHNNVYCLLEDNVGNIWFGTTDGLSIYEPSRSHNLDSKKITPIKLPENFTPSSNNDWYGNANATKKTVWSLLQDKKGTIWIGTGDGLFCHEPSTEVNASSKLFTRFLDNYLLVNKENLHLKMIDCMLEDKSGNIWFGSGMPPGMEGICKYDGKTLVSFKPEHEGWIRNIIETKNGNLLFTTRRKGICRYDGKNFIFETQPSGVVPSSMMSCFEDTKGNTWYTSDYGKQLNDTLGGLWKYDGKIVTKYSVKDGLTSNAVFMVFEDRGGNIWIGTRNMGLYRFDGKQFTSFSE